MSSFSFRSWHPKRIGETEVCFDFPQTIMASKKSKQETIEITLTIPIRYTITYEKFCEMTTADGKPSTLGDREWKVLRKLPEEKLRRTAGCSYLEFSKFIKKDIEEMIESELDWIKKRLRSDDETWVQLCPPTEPLSDTWQILKKEQPEKYAELLQLYQSSSSVSSSVSSSSSSSSTSS